MKILNRRPIFVVAALLGLAIAAYLLIGLVRLYIAPFILRTLWHVYLMRESLPEVMIWAIFVALVPVLAAFVLIGDRAGEQDRSGIVLSRVGGRVSELRRLLVRANRGRYFQRQLERHLADLAVELVQQQEHLTEEEARTLLRSGDFSLQPEARRVLEGAWRRRISTVEPQPGLLKRLSRFLQRAGENDTVVDPQLLAMIRYLETELEVDSGD